MLSLAARPMLQNPANAHERRRGAFRSAPQLPLCKVCGEAEEQIRCPRCGACCCDEHQPRGDGWCEDCEATYALLADDRRRHPFSPADVLVVHGLTSVVVASTAGWLASQPGAPWTVFGVACVASVVPLFVALFRRRRFRARFLGSRQTDPKMFPSRLLDTARPSRPGWDGPSIAAFIASLFFFLPFVPLGGAVTGFVAAARETPLKRRGRWLGHCAVVLGGFFTYAQYHIWHTLAHAAKECGCWSKGYL